VFATNLLSQGWPVLVFLIWIGLSVGSFLNVVIYRVPVMLKRDWHGQAHEILELSPPDKSTLPFNLVTPRSRCPNCEFAIPALHNVPIISWLALRGPLRQLQSADLGTLSVGGDSHCGRFSGGRCGLRVHVDGRRGARIHVGHRCAHVHRFRHEIAP
jgi:hypothetical protein